MPVGTNSGPDEGVADLLCRARKDFGQDLRTVAQVLRIRYVYLEAIEAGEFSRLPGNAYAIGFIRTYAEFLGLDGDEIVDRFKAESVSAKTRTELVFPEPVTEGRIPGGAIILVSVLLLGLAYGGWFYLSNRGQSIGDLISPLPDRLQAMLDSGSEAPAEQNAITAGDAKEVMAPVIDEASSETAASEPIVETLVEAPIVETPIVETPTVETPAPEPLLSDTDSAAVEQPVETTAINESAEIAATTIIEAPAASTLPQAAVEPASNEITANSPVIEAAGSEAVESAPLQITALPPAEETEASETVSAELAEAAPLPLIQETTVIPSAPAVPLSSLVPSERTPRVYGENNQDARIVVRATQDSWVQVRDKDETLLLTRVLRIGDTYLVPNLEGLTLLTGNAGGIEIEVDGVKAPPLGPVGSVRREIVLDPARLVGGTAGKSARKKAQSTSGAAAESATGR